MLALTARFAGLVGLDRERFGGLETGDGASAFGFTPLGFSAESEDPSLTWGFAGLIGVYRDVSAVSALSEAVGAGTFPFAAAGYSSDLQDLTGSFGGLIAVWRNVSITPTTQYTFSLSAIVNGTVDPLTARTLEITFDGTVGGSITIQNDIRAVGASTFPLAALGRAGMAAASVFPFTAFGGGTSVQNPQVFASGKGTFPLAAEAVGEPTWPTVGASTFPFYASATFEGLQMTVGGSVFPFTAQAVSPGYSLSVGVSTFPFEAVARAAVLYLGGPVDVDSMNGVARPFGTMRAASVAYGSMTTGAE